MNPFHNQSDSTTQQVTADQIHHQASQKTQFKHIPQDLMAFSPLPNAFTHKHTNSLIDPPHPPQPVNSTHLLHKVQQFLETLTLDSGSVAWLFLFVHTADGCHQIILLAVKFHFTGFQFALILCQICRVLQTEICVS